MDRAVDDVVNKPDVTFHRQRKGYLLSFSYDASELRTPSWISPPSGNPSSHTTVLLSIVQGCPCRRPKVVVAIIMPEYGSIPSIDQDPNHSFEEYDVNYIQSKSLTTKERWTKLLKAAVPIVIALLLVGGFGWWASQAVAPSHSSKVTVDYKNPVPAPTGRGGGSTITAMGPPREQSVTVKPSIPTTLTTNTKTDTSTKSVTTSGGTGGGDGSLCTARAKCARLGLIGDCCPTSEGVVLGCCD
jgi:hypothetical protein